MIWPLIERIITYVFILGILYICSQTILQWNEKRHIEAVKEELRKEFESDRRDLQRQVDRVDSHLSDYNLSNKSRMDALEEQLKNKQESK